MSDDKNRLMRIRSEKNKRRPKFIRENYYRLKRIQTSWRRPKGIDSKMRHKLKGKRKSPGTGYRNPRAVRGLHPSGYEIVRIHTVDELDDIDPSKQVVQIGRTVGSRKRMDIIKYAEELDLHIINPQVRKEEIVDEFEEEADFELDDDENLELVEEDE